MFNLEQSISEWRRQMLAAGISAAALDELESHLREEIQERKQLGSSEAEAFQVGIEKIGHGEMLILEFRKAEATEPMETAINSLIQIIGWIAAGCVLLLGLDVLDVRWDLFSFKPEWSPFVLGAMFHILIAESGIWFLAKVNRDGLSRGVSLFICLFLGWIALNNYHGQMHPHRIFGGERNPNPFWYCWTTTSLYLLPGIFWISRCRPLRRKNDQRIAPAALVAERVFSIIAALYYIIVISVCLFQWGNPGNGAGDLLVDSAALLAILLIICGGCLISIHVGKKRRARRWVE